jgi:hypothetical protein
MRMRTIMAVTAAALGFGLGFSEPAAAGGWDHGCCGGNTYIHHHVYYPPRFVHIYHHHLPVTRHINVVHYRYGGCCGYFGPRRAYRWHGFRRYW